MDSNEDITVNPYSLNTAPGSPTPMGPERPQGGYMDWLTSICRLRAVKGLPVLFPWHPSTGSNAVVQPWM